MLKNKFEILSFNEYLNENNNSTTSRYFSKIELKTEDIFNIIEYQDSFRNLYPDYDEYDNEYEEDYYFQSKEEAYKNVNDILDFFNSMDNPIQIYRAILVDTIDDIDFEYLGDSWSFEKQSAIDFANKQNLGNVLISAETNPDNVNWLETVKLFFIYSKNYDGYDENEIRIIDPSVVFNIKTEYIK